jgi:hypothetical protein
MDVITIIVIKYHMVLPFLLCADGQAACRIDINFPLGVVYFDNDACAWWLDCVYVRKGTELVYYFLVLHLGRLWLRALNSLAVRVKVALGSNQSVRGRLRKHAVGDKQCRQNPIAQCLYQGNYRRRPHRRVVEADTLGVTQQAQRIECMSITALRRCCYCYA